MSVLSIAPEAVSDAVENLENLGSALRSATAAAANRTIAFAAPASDQVSTAVASIFGAHAQEFQALSSRAAAFHDQFVRLLNGAAAQYVNAELANAQNLVNSVNGTSPAAAIAVIGLTEQTFNIPFGPFTITLNQTLTPTISGFSGIIHAGLSFNAPGGLVNLFSGNGNENFSSINGILSGDFTGSGASIWATGNATLNEITGAFAAALTGHGPSYSADGSIDGILPVNGTGYPQITALSLMLDGRTLPVTPLIGDLNKLLQQLFAYGVVGR
ncbi:PE family protein [Mycobacterium helveticum]|uniref:PE domain-containing protein n=1 Tax=Mycobacterium helveticum TaxID=2592811 RepID=A0A557XW95_9MYCO|nr:PE family protein [Mycobacterium helveticum]TVS87910.1 PE domain-containing protein [Mycobacterium helveticum]TVS90291.1 PE domain-containing protein [Mycobacterium helveticum]